MSDEEENKLNLEMKNEGVTRLRLLKLYVYAREFYNGIIHISYVYKNIIDSVNEYEKQIISNLQDIKKIMIYHIIKINDNITYYLYVDRNKEEWLSDKMALRKRICRSNMHKIRKKEQLALKQLTVLLQK